MSCCWCRQNRNKNTLCCMNCCAVIAMLLALAAGTAVGAFGYFGMLEAKAVSPCCDMLANCSWAVNDCSCSISFYGRGNVSALPANTSACIAKKEHADQKNHPGPGFRRVQTPADDSGHDFKGICLSPDACDRYERTAEIPLSQIAIRVVIAVIPLIPATCTCVSGLMLCRDPYIRCD